MAEHTLHIVVKTFDELSKDELYELLWLRSEIFVIEQHCVYQDLDYKDQKALHILGKRGTKLVAYTRIFDANDYFEHASIGRVLVQKAYRKYGYGHAILSASIATVYSRFKTQQIVLSAQEHLLRFYNAHGFTEFGEVYLEDGIPHMKMIKD